MKLLVIGAYYPPHQIGGYELRCREVVEGLERRGHQSLIFTTECPAKGCPLHADENDILRILHQKTEANNVFHQILNDISDMRQIDYAVKTFKPDIIYLWGIQNLSNAILPYFSDQNIPIVFDEGGGGLIYLNKIFNRGLYFYEKTDKFILKTTIKNLVNFATKIISLGRIKPNWTWPGNMNIYFNSHSAKDYAKKSGMNVEDAKVIYPGIDIINFPFSTRGKLNDPLEIIVPGRIKEEKGTKDAVLLIKALRYRNIDASLRIIGANQSDEYFSEIMKLAELNNVKNSIKYIPMVSQEFLANFYQESDFCFFPTRFKTGLSRVPLEAMASGSVVLSFGNEGSKEIIEDNQTGFIIPQGNIERAADIIEGLVSHPEKYHQIRNNARKEIEENYSLDPYIDSIQQYLNECLQNREKN
jgi:glycosyltransferase involved in cell wall biosynthesis